MKNIVTMLSLISICVSVFPQFPPPAGQEGSTAIFFDSTIFTGWAKSCNIERGSINISIDTTNVTFGFDENATGIADNEVVSLGDGGIAILNFEFPITNGDGFDFAVFENALNDTFLELAFVEVSSDGENFFRFESTSLTQSDNQVATFGELDTRKINNLAGKYKYLFGTPFDLQELEAISDLDLNNITHIKIIDVVGCIQDEYATTDAFGNKVNDPWPTPFESGGFDLDAIGVIHQNTEGIEDTFINSNISCFPNPCKDQLNITSSSELIHAIVLTDVNGKEIYFDTNFNSGSKTNISTTNLYPGIYFLRILTESHIYHQKLIKK